MSASQGSASSPTIVVSKANFKCVHVWAAPFLTTALSLRLIHDFHFKCSYSTANDPPADNFCFKAKPPTSDQRRTGAGIDPRILAFNVPVRTNLALGQKRPKI